MTASEKILWGAIPTKQKWIQHKEWHGIEETVAVIYDTGKEKDAWKEIKAH